ncbi:polyprenyl synthetase family protein [Streptomyces aidingensis]|uniref:Polyprenyl synthetase n=1 Tax=Streptomyces aidingensis TaxID=910347 RepID=A0A1I1SLX3_9ACTN|nr:polyprenyl synthetase family protein [Streptomyces aidingensis]SFD47302.1 Polyprenyl synthetase [Streptomyces aidingensis]
MSRTVTMPYPFQQADLRFGRLIGGARQTLGRFAGWRERNAPRIAAHIDRYTAHTRRLAADHRRRADRRGHLAREITYFGVYNLAEVPDPATVLRVLDGAPPGLTGLPDRLARGYRRGGTAGVLAAVHTAFPELRGLPETGLLAGRLERLQAALPERVLREGAMGKVARTLAGVLAIAAYDTAGRSRAERTAQLGRTVLGGYAMGAAYAIVDDAFHDAPPGALPPAERARCHRMLLRGLGRGIPPGPGEIPDHPLAEELADLHREMLADRPFAAHRHLYRAATAMYLAQDMDADGPPDPPPGGADPADRYPAMFVKAAMSRCIANILGRRALPDGFYTRCLNTIFLSQLRDDLKDRDEDLAAGRGTVFTVPRSRSAANPLYDMFAYEAYVASEVYGDDPVVADSLSYFGAKSLAPHLAADPAAAARTAAEYEATPQIRAFFETAVDTLRSRRLRRRVMPLDKRLKHRVAEVSRRTARTRPDVRVYLADRIPDIDRAVRRWAPPAAAGRAEHAAGNGNAGNKDAGLAEIIGYTLFAPGKRVRAGLTLMLADSLRVPHRDLEPLLAAGEMFHTASLIFDDLPAQDNAALRRGRPAAHTVYDEGAVQLAGISLISHAFGLLPRLSAAFPAARVGEVIAYTGTVLGSERLCRGQHLDLAGAHRPPDAPPAPVGDILAMYRLKTSTTIESALLPLMLLLDRPAAETAAVSRFADAAGIVFQLRDDLLDATAQAAVLGKTAHQDATKSNVVRDHGIAEARRLMAEQVRTADRACDELPFDTGLLRGAVRYFASRRR